MPIILDGTAGIDNDATDLNYTGTLTGGTGVVNLGSGQVYKDASGNVGIGTSSFTFNNRLNIKQSTDTGASAFGLRVERQANDSLCFLGYRDNTNTWQLNATFGSTGAFAPITFHTSDAERMRIDSSGNLLVGTTSSYGGMINFLTSSSRINAIVTRPATNITYNAADFQNSSGTGVGGIGVTSSSTAYVTSSDYRLKHDIQPMTGALAKVQALKPCTYKWNADDSAGEGFIAHELQAVCPDAVVGQKDAVDAEGNPQYQGIDTSFLVATLTAAIQELKAINDAQAQTIAAQQTALESLTARVVALEQA